MTDAIWLALATFLFTVLGTAVTTTWRVGRILDDRDRVIIKMMNDHELADARRFSEANENIGEMGEVLRREFGETGTALRQKMHDMETWNRDTFLRRQSFYEGTKEMASDIKRLLDQVARMDSRRGGTEPI